MSSVLKKADKPNLSLSLAPGSCGSTCNFKSVTSEHMLIKFMGASYENAKR